MSDSPTEQPPLTVNLILHLLQDGDPHFCKEALITLAQQDQLPSPQDRRRILEQVNKTFNAMEPAGHIDLAAGMNAVVQAWRHSMPGVGKDQQKALFSLYKKFAESPLPDVVENGTRSIGSFVLLCPDYLTRFLQTFEEITTGDIGKRQPILERTKIKPITKNVLKENIAAQLAVIAKAIVRIPMDSQDLYDSCLDAFEDITTSLSKESLPSIRRNVALNLQKIKKTLSGDGDELCDSLEEILKTDPEPSVIRALRAHNRNGRDSSSGEVQKDQQPYAGDDR